MQGDIKYGPDIRLRDGTLVKTCLSSLIDDHSRFIVQSEFYDNQRQEVVEDTFHKAILKYGKCDACYLDNGTQYTSNQLHTALARLGIRVLHAKPRACQSKVKVEKFHQKVDQYIAEIRIAQVHSLEELNQKLLSVKLDAPAPCRLDAPDLDLICYASADCLHQHLQVI